MMFRYRVNPVTHTIILKGKREGREEERIIEQPPPCPQRFIFAGQGLFTGHHLIESPDPDIARRITFLED